MQEEDPGVVTQTDTAEGGNGSHDALEEEVVAVVSLDSGSSPSSSSPTKLVQPPEKPAKSASQLIKRGFVLNEFVESERVYAERLQIAYDVFVQPMDRLGILEAQEINSHFFLWELLLGLHKDFYTNLKADFEEGTLNIGARFKSFSPYLKCYSQYLSNFTSAFDARVALLAQNKRFGAFVESAQADARCLGLSIESFLVEPVQRVPRYRLLLESLLKTTAEGHPERESVQEALDMVMGIAQANNDAIKERENKHKIMQLMCMLTSSTRINLLDDPARLLLKEGVLLRQCRKNLKEFSFWLFTDKLLYAEKTATGNSYSLHREISLSSCRVSAPAATSEEEEVATTLATKDKSASSPAVNKQQSFFSSIFSMAGKAAGGAGGGGDEGGGGGGDAGGGAGVGGWRHALFVESRSKSFLAFAETEADRDEWLRATQDAITALRSQVARESKSDVVAPLWVPDAAANSCQRCLATFTFTLRRHHCRSCGMALCDACSANKCKLLHVDAEREVRVCDKCFEANTLWVADSNAQNCKHCSLPFTTLTRRRHHCRSCGACVCDACSKHRVLLVEVDPGKESRICAPCFEERSHK